MKPDGRYTLLRTYPMCRWSGQLGPKVREGDRQVPEGFYKITPGQMNPNSNYYLAFNVGYPNAYDRAWGHEGGSIMVHGAFCGAWCWQLRFMPWFAAHGYDCWALSLEGHAGSESAEVRARAVLVCLAYSTAPHTRPRGNAGPRQRPT